MNIDPALHLTDTLRWIFKTIVLQGKSAGRHVTLPEHSILTPSWPVFALFYDACFAEKQHILI